MNKKIVAREWLYFLGFFLFGLIVFPALLFFLADIFSGEPAPKFSEWYGELLGALFFGGRDWVARLIARLIVAFPYLLFLAARSVMWAWKTINNPTSHTDMPLASNQASASSASRVQPVVPNMDATTPCASAPHPYPDEQQPSASSPCPAPPLMPPVQPKEVCNTPLNQPVDVMSPREQPINIGQIIRDIIIVWIFTAAGGFVVGFASTILELGPLWFQLGVAVSNFLLGTVAFAIVGCLAPSDRWRHLIWVAIGAWVASIINVLVFGFSFTHWAFSVIFMGVIMGLGGAISHVFKKNPSRKASAAPNPE